MPAVTTSCSVVCVDSGIVRSSIGGKGHTHRPRRGIGLRVLRGAAVTPQRLQNPSKRMHTEGAGILFPTLSMAVHVAHSLAGRVTQFASSQHVFPSPWYTFAAADAEAFGKRQ